LDDEEVSAGTLKFAHLAGELAGALRSGSPLVVDEIDAPLHPRLMVEVVRLFTDPASNPRGAQLVFATPDAVALREAPLGREQVWWTGRDRSSGASSLVSRAEIGRGAGVGRDGVVDDGPGRFEGVPRLAERLSGGER
jgi:hypothetical protein